MRIRDHYLSGNPFQFVYQKRNEHDFNETFHAHQGMEFCYIHEGKGRLILNQHIYPLHRGMLLFFQPYQMHRVQMNVSMETPFVRSLLVFEPAEFLPYLQSFPHLHAFFEQMWHKELKNQIVKDGGGTYSIADMIRQFHMEDNRRTVAEWREAYSLFLLHFFQRLYRKWRGEQVLSAGQKERHAHHAERMMHWIESRYMHEFHLEQLARDLHLSKYHVSHVFKLATGSTLTEYITARRLRQACWLLSTSTQTIQQIGMEVGFNSSAYFTSIFRKRIGMTPRAYRTKCRQNPGHDHELTKEELP